MGSQQTVSSSPQNLPCPLPSVVHESPKTILTSPLLSPIIEDLTQSLPLDTGGDIISSNPNLLTIPVNCSFAPLSLVDTRPAGTELLLSPSLAQGLSNTGLSHSSPTPVEMLHPVPIPTYLGKSPIINDSRDLPSTSHCDFSSDSARKDFSWSRGLGLETSPIKTRSARRKSCTSVTLPTVTSTDTSDLGALRGIKSLARSRP
jgi:hypothetical protein